MRQICDILLSSNFLSYVGRVISDLKLDSIWNGLLLRLLLTERGLVNLLQPFYGHFYELFSFLLVNLVFQVESSSSYRFDKNYKLTWIKHGLSNIGSECLCDWVAEFSTFVDNHLDDETKVGHLFTLY